MRSWGLALVVFAIWGLSLSGLDWLVGRGFRGQEEDILTQALEGFAELDRAVRAHPEAARRRFGQLLKEAIAIRSRGEDADPVFEQALRLGISIEDGLSDPSFREAGTFYRELDAERAESKQKADDLAEQSESGYRAGRSEEAKEQATRALRAYRELGDHWGELRTIHLLGSIYWVAGEAEEARFHYSELLEKANRHRDRYREAAALNNLAMLDEARGELRKAAAQYQQVWSMGQAHGLRRIQGFALLYQANLYHRLGVHERAADGLERAEEVFHELGDGRMEAMAASNRGASLHRMGDLDEALNAYRHALELRSREGDRSGRVRTLLHVAELLHELGESERATSVLDELLSLTQGSNDATSRQFRWGALVTAADIALAEGRVELARSFVQEAEIIAREVGHTMDGVETSRRRAAVRLAENQPQGAVAELERAVELIEKLRSSPEVEEERIRFLDMQESVYKDLASIHLRQLNQPLAAFETLEKSRSRAFLDSLRGGVLVEADASGAPQVLLSSSAGPAPTERIVSRLPPDSALLHYTVAPRWFAVIAFDSKGLCDWSVFDMEQGELERIVGEFSERSGDTATPSRLRTESEEQLSRWLLQPVAALLDEYRTLIIVPDGVLFGIPWAALRWNGRYLIEKRELVIEPSASAFVHLTNHAQRPRVSTTLLVANPVAGGSRVAGDAPPEAPSGRRLMRPLLEAEIEAKQLEALLPRARTLLGDQATEPAVRSEIGEYDIVHFGTHASIVSDRPLTSSLLLAGGSDAIRDPRLAPVVPSDGVLTGYEVLGLELRPGAMVTLAACESVGGGHRRGEGVVGLARAFFEAGASTVVASLWPVEDRATRELMVRFHRELSSGQRSTAQALARAQRAMARGSAGKRREHPYYWAGFMLIGDGR